MPLDLPPDPTRRLRGQSAYQDGLAAEEIVRLNYERRGHKLIENRWRGRAGEIDLIFQSANELIFVEVKKARTHDAAKSRLSDRQLLRMARSAEDFIGTYATDPLMPMRLDLAMVDSTGAVAILENLTLY